jgi:hypothetical protein
MIKKERSWNLLTVTKGGGGANTLGFVGFVEGSCGSPIIDDGVNAIFDDRSDGCHGR